MSFALLISFGLGFLIAASMARQLVFRGGWAAATVAAALLATAAASFAGAAAGPSLVAALVGAGLGVALQRRN